MCWSSNPWIHQCPVLLSRIFYLNFNARCGKLKATWLDRFGLKIKICITVRENSSKKTNQKTTNTMEPTNTKKKLKWWNQIFVSLTLNSWKFPVPLPILWFQPSPKPFCATIKYCISVVQIQRRKLHQMRPKYKQVINNSGRPPLLNSSAWSHNNIKRCVCRARNKNTRNNFKLDGQQ